MKSSQSKFSRKQPSHPEKESGSKTSSMSGCCCGSKLSDEIDEVEIIEDDKETEKE